MEKHQRRVNTDILYIRVYFSKGLLRVALPGRRLSAGFPGPEQQENGEEEDQLVPYIYCFGLGDYDDWNRGFRRTIAHSGCGSSGSGKICHLKYPLFPPLHSGRDFYFCICFFIRKTGLLPPGVLDLPHHCLQLKAGHPHPYSQSLYALISRGAKAAWSVEAKCDPARTA